MIDPDPTQGSAPGLRSLQPGDWLGPYQVEGPLGTGGMGEVVVAYDQRLDRRVAIKRIRRATASANRDSAAADRARLRREARAAAGLNHPAIVQIYDILTDGDGDAIVMELVEGRSLAQLLGNGPLALTVALRLARQVAEGLAEAHRVGLVHRDLKAENVMVTPASGDQTSRAKILDFGLAKILPQSPSGGTLRQPPSGGTLTKSELDETLTQAGAVLGTVRAMSPEQAQGGEVNHRSDLFSFGVLLYEMLTGRSPFRGANALSTLRRVITESPQPVRELRTEVPVELASLIARLLDKQPERRPAGAGEVARALADLTDRIHTGTVPPTSPPISDSFSNVPTGSFVEVSSPEGGQAGHSPEGGQAGHSPEGGQAGHSPGGGQAGHSPEGGQAADSRKGEQAERSLAPTENMQSAASGESALGLVSYRRRWLVAVAVLVFLAVLVGVLLRASAGRSEPLRVVVLRPQINAQKPATELELVASGVLIAALGTLADLEGLAPVEPKETRQTSGSVIEIARAIAADEVLTAGIETHGGTARILLRRIRGADGEILWANSFDVPLRTRAARLVAEAITVQLQHAYPAHSLRAGTAKLLATDADYEEFVAITHRVDAGETTVEPELERLEAIVDRSPRFLAAHLLAASLGLTLYEDNKDPENLERARGLIQRALDLAPMDAKVIEMEFRSALANGDREAAEDVLAKLVRAAPNSIAVHLGRFRLAKQRGDLAEAQTAMELAVERRPSWVNLYRLADLEYLRGDVENARRHLEEMIRRVPANTRGLAKLAQLELRYGDLERSEDLLLTAIKIRPHRSYLTNLGLVRFLLGRYPQARASYLQALEIDPDNMTVQLNLADVELALGHEAEAGSWYLKIKDGLEQREHESTESMTLAQCLARLGDSQRAVAVTLETLQKYPEHSEVAYQAALVYTLVGETASALVNVEKALAMGVQPRWFTIPGFDVLGADPRFQVLLDDHGERGQGEPAG